jgi:hypothetical protein
MSFLSAKLEEKTAFDRMALQQRRMMNARKRAASLRKGLTKGSRRAQ